MLKNKIKISSFIALIILAIFCSAGYAQNITLVPNEFDIKMTAGETIVKNITAIWDGNKAISAEIILDVKAKNTDTEGFSVIYPNSVLLKPNKPTIIPITISAKPNLVPDTFYITLKASANPPRSAIFSAMGGNVELFKINNYEVKEVTRQPLIWYGNIYYYLSRRKNYTISGSMILTFDGNVEINRTLTYWYGVRELKFKQPVVASFSFDRIIDCEDISKERVYCIAEGYAILTPKGSCYADYEGGRIFTNCRIGYNIKRVDRITLEIKGGRINLEGRSEEDVFKISNMNLLYFNIYLSLIHI